MELTLETNTINCVLYSMFCQYVKDSLGVVWKSSSTNGDYGLEACVVKLDERRKLLVLQMKFLRYIFAVTKMDRWRKEEVRRRVGLREKMSDRVDWNVFKWFGRGWRMD